MPDEISRFHTSGPSWSERAGLGELNAVLSPFGADWQNRFLHGVNSAGSRIAARYFKRNDKIVDFGCGTGRFARYFAEKGYRVIGTEITPEMIEQAQHFLQTQTASLL